LQRTAITRDSDVVTCIPHHTVPSVSSSSSSFNQLPLSVVQTVTDDTPQSQDRPMDYSVNSRWTQSAETVVNGNATLSRGSTASYHHRIDHFSGPGRVAGPRCVCVSDNYCWTNWTKWPWPRYLGCRLTVTLSSSGSNAEEENNSSATAEVVDSGW